MINFDYISSHITILHGISGAGKGEIVEELKKQSRNHFHEDGKIVHIATGDFFRQAIKEDPEISAKMNRGEFIETLDPIAPYLVAKLKEVVMRWANGGDVMIVFDGAFRRGEYVSKNTGEIIPSQFNQVGGFLFTALKECLSEEKFASKCDPLLRGALLYSDKPNAQFIDQTLKDSTHVLVDVTSHDAESLMLFRCIKELKKTLKWINEHLDSVSSKGRLDNGTAAQMMAIEDYVLRSLQIQSMTTKKDIDLDTIWHLEDDSLKPMMDKWLSDLNKEICLTYGLGEQKFISNSLKLIGVRVLGDKISVPTHRSDDETRASRKKRIEEYRDYTVNEILIGELGYAYDYEKEIASSNIDNRLVLYNGPSNKVSYEELQRRAGIVANGLINRMVKREGVVKLENVPPVSFKERIG